MTLQIRKSPSIEPYYMDQLNKTPLFLMIIFQILLHIAMTGQSALMPLVLGYALAYILLSKIQYGFYMMIAVAVFEGALEINGQSIAVFVILAYFVKLLWKSHFRFGLDRVEAISIIYIVALELIWEIRYPHLGSVAVFAVEMLLSIYILTHMECIRVKPFELITYVSVTFLFVVLYILECEGGLFTFISKVMKASWAVRFGSAQALEVGGAMAVPLYSITILSLVITYAFSAPKIQRAHQIFMFIAAGGAALFGALTISRSFFLGLGFMAVYILLSCRQDKFISIFKLMMVVLAFSIALLMMYPGVLYKIIDLLTLRNTINGSGGRLEIWQDCFSYMSEHPVNLLFGAGSLSYPNLTAEYGRYKFSAGAHNLLLDIFMSWGIVGVFFSGLLVKHQVVKIKMKYGNIDKILFMQLASYLVFGLTALNTSGFRTWIFLLISLFIIQCLMEADRS